MASSEPNLPPGYDLQRLPEIDSTSSEAFRQIAEGVRGPKWIWADRQIAGRGRRGREWVSQAGNLFCTLILPVDKPIAEASKLSFVASLAAADTVQQYAANLNVQVKWPNDVLLCDKKIVGILLESNSTDLAGEEGVILTIGIGINLVSHPENVETEATSLKSQGIDPPSTADVLSTLSECFENWFKEWRSNGFGKIRQRWLDKAKGLGGEIVVRLPQETLNGVFHDLDPSGALVLREAEGGVKLINAGEVFFAAGKTDE